MSHIGETSLVEQPVSLLSSSFSHKTALPEKKSILECPPNLNAPVPIIELISLFVKITAIVFIKYDYMNKSDYMILCTYLYIIIQRGFHGFELVVGEISRDEDSHNSMT